MCDRGFKRQSQGIMAALPFPVAIATIPSGKLRRYAHFSWWQYIRHFSIVLHNMVDIVKTAAGFMKAIWLLLKFRPDVVFAKGGFVCLPVGYAARLLRIPLVIHDSDVRPGLTNRLLARFATAIGTGMPLENYTYNKRVTTYVGVPIDPAITPVTETQRRSYRVEFDLPLDKQVVVAVGGGLGSVAINHAVIATAQRQTSDAVLFCNVTGVNNHDEALALAGDTPMYRALPFVYKDMYKLLGAADLVVTRASATTLQELAGLKQAVVAVPARQLGDQQQNATLFAAYDAVVALQDSELSVNLATTVEALLHDSARRSQLANNLYTFARPHAARDMAHIITEIASK